MKMGISKKIIAVLTAVAMLVSGLTLVVPEKAKAASGVKMIAPGVSCIAAPTAGAEGWTGDFIFYGSYKGQPLKWRVLDASGTAGNSSVEGGVLLQVPDVLREDGAEVRKPYAEVGDWLNGNSEGQFLEGFGTEEKSALIASEKKAVAGSPTGLLKSADLTGQKVFLLDAADLATAAYGYRYENGASKCGIQTDGLWWLRSGYRTEGRGVQGCVLQGGMVFYSFADEGGAVVPAINVQRDKVLFTSSVNFDKTAALSKVVAADNAEWRFTLRDPAYSVTVGSEVERNGSQITVPYTASAPGNGQISLMISDGDYTGGNILYYGKAADINGAGSGTVSFTLPDGFNEGSYKVYLIAENVNAGGTDLACEPVAFAIPPLHVHSWSEDWYSNDDLHWHDCQNPGCDITDPSAKDGCGQHSWEEVTVTESTCLTPYSYYEECTVCGRKTETVTEEDWEPGEGHEADEEDDGTVLKEPTCSEEGLWQYRCIHCGQMIAEEMETTDHDFGDWETIKEPKKGEAGLRKRTCSMCGEEEEEEIPALHEHSYTETVTKAAACEESGVKTFTCSCGDSYTETIKATGHRFGKWTQTVAPTEKTEGKQQRICSRCGMKEERTLPVIPHVHSYPKNGWKTTKTHHWSECSCGNKKDTGVHEWNKGKITKKPTEKEVGSVTYTCKQCGYKKKAVIPRLDSVMNVGNYSYQFKEIKGGELCVKVLGFAAKKKTSAVKLPGTITVGGARLTVKKVGRRAFYGNKNITSVVIPDTVEEVHSLSFYKNTKLKTVELGSGVKRINRHAFCGLKSLKKFTVHSTNLIRRKVYFLHGNKNYKIELPEAKFGAYQKLFRGLRARLAEIKK